MKKDNSYFWRCLAASESGFLQAALPPLAGPLSPLASRRLNHFSRSLEFSPSLVNIHSRAVSMSQRDSRRSNLPGRIDAILNRITLSLAVVY